MIIEKKLLNKIKELGLNTYEAKIWTALLSRGVSTAGEISDIANVPRSRSYDVLESLEKKGFIIMKVGKPIQYIAVPPEEALERVKKGVEEEAGKTIELLEEFESSKILTELTTLHNTGIESVDPTEITGFVKGRVNILNQMKSMIKNAQKTVVLNSSEGDLEFLQESLKSVLKKASGNNVNIRVCGTGNFAHKNVDFSNSNLNGRFLVVDSNVVLFSITDLSVHDDYDTSVWVESPFLATTFEQAFEQARANPNVQTRVKVTQKVKQ